MFFCLVWYEVTLRDFDLFIFRISGDANNFHPVEKRLRHVEAICCRDKHDVRQVVIHVQIMIVKCIVLFGVEHFQERRRRVAAMVLAHFINFIKEKERIVKLRFLHGLNDASRHRADIGPAMTANFALITYAAKRDADKFPSRSAGNRFPERGLSDTRRSDEAQDGAF